MKKPAAAIYYCPGCKWLARSTWMAQELLETFSQDLGAVSIHPSDISGTFKVLIDGVIIWDRAEEGGCPQIKELKKRVRDNIAPERKLGHIDR